MIEPSPPPRRRRIPRRTWMVAGVLGVGLTLIALVAFPGWAAPFVRDRLARALERRFDAPVEVADVDLAADRVEIVGLSIGTLPRGRIYADRVVAALDPGARWRLRVVVTEVDVTGGSVEGTRAGLTDLLARPAASTRPGEPKASRVSLRPRRLDATGVRVDVSDFAGPATSAQATVDLEGRWPDGAVRVDLQDVRLRQGGEAGREILAKRAQAKLQGVGTPSGIRFPVELAVRGAALTLTPEIAVAGVHGTVAASDPAVERLEIDLAGTFSDSVAGGTGPDLWTAAGYLRRDMSEGRLDLTMEAFELRRVPQVLARLPLVDSESATVGGSLEVTFGEGRAQTRGEVRLAGLSVSHPLLARDVVRDLGFDLAFEAEIEPHERRLEIESARVRRGGVTLDVAGTLVHPPTRDGRKYDLRLRVPPVPCQAVLDAMPSQLAPSLEGFVLDGDFELDLQLGVDYAKLEELQLGGKVGMRNCRVRQVPPRVSGARLGGPFTHRIVMKDGRERIVRLFAGSQSFTPLGRISPFMVAAVLTTEDGGFFRHRGFLPSQFTTALRRNLEAGRVRYGASTLTMQMVKNVLLSHERTLSRKLQEMFLTWYVEQALTKDRIMEIYLNVVEFGPGLYGVTAAADHYFGKDPIDLNPLESAYLAMMLPSPVKRHLHYCRGELSASFDVKLRRILRFMYERERIEQADYEAFRDAPLLFSRFGVDEARCVEETRRLLEAGSAQRALTGLLGRDRDGREIGGAMDEETDDGEDYGFGIEVGPTPLPSVLEDPDDPDPSEADAPGRPAMEELPVPEGA